MREIPTARAAPQGSSLRAPRTTRWWSGWIRWFFGVVGPVLCCSGAIILFRSGNLPVDLMHGGRPFALTFATAGVAAEVAATLRPRRGGLLSALLAGCLFTMGLFGLLHSVTLGPLGLIVLLHEPTLGLLGLLPIPATYVFLRSAWEEVTAACEDPRRSRVVLTGLLGLALPPGLAGAGSSLAQRVEQGIVERLVDGRSDPAEGDLSRWRAVAWIHDWPSLVEAVRQGPFDEGASPTGRAARAGEVWSALTGLPAWRLQAFD